MLKLAGFRATFLILALLSGREGLIACSCARIGPACEVAWKADAVFVGTPVHVDPLTIFGIPLAWPPFERHVRFAVKERFVGAMEKTIEVTTGMGGGDCGINFQRGRDYLIYAYRTPITRVLYTGICTRTSYLENAAGDLAYLRSLARSAPPARACGFITSNAMDFFMGKKATEPLVGVRVHLKSNAREWQTTTDAAGAYDFPELPSGTLSMSADLPRSLGGGGIRTVTLHEHGCSQQILLAVEQAEWRGRVLDDLDHPVQTSVVLVPVAQTGRKAPGGYSGADGLSQSGRSARGTTFWASTCRNPLARGPVSARHGNRPIIPAFRIGSWQEKFISTVRSTCRDSNFVFLTDSNRGRLQA